MYFLGYDQKYVLEILKLMSVCLNVYQQNHLIMRMFNACAVN